MKNISKSIRLSKKVYDYIDSFEGEGFNQKFENIILFAMEQEDQKRKRVKELDNLISVRSEELTKLNSNLSAARSETRRFLSAIRELDGMKL